MRPAQLATSARIGVINPCETSGAAAATRPLASSLPVTMIYMPFMRLSEKQRQALELEVVPSEARLELTRIIRDRCRAVSGDEDGGIALLRENEFINIANQVLGRPIYTLEGGDWGEYHPAEHAWHHGQRELIMRVPTTSQLAEILADYLQREMMNRRQVNAILTDYNCGFCFQDISGDDSIDIDIKIVAADSIPDADLTKDHPNVRKLVFRMDTALSTQDFSGVLHASASIFETLAKDVMQSPTLNDQTLAGFFAGYRKRSLLPVPVLDYMLEVYKARNKQPLAGHGSLALPTVDAAQAVVLCELTKSIVRIERSLAEQAIDLSKTATTKTAASTGPPTVAACAPSPTIMPSNSSTAHPSAVDPPGPHANSLVEPSGCSSDRDSH